MEIINIGCLIKLMLARIKIIILDLVLHVEGFTGCDDGKFVWKYEVEAAGN